MLDVYQQSTGKVELQPIFETLLTSLCSLAVAVGLAVATSSQTMDRSLYAYLCRANCCINGDDDDARDRCSDCRVP